MNPEELKTACLSLRAAVEEFPFGPETSVFKVGGKVFALSSLDADPLTVSLKCEPELAVQLRAAHPGTVVGGYHLNKRHWNTVMLDGSLPEEAVRVREMIEDSYDLVAASLTRVARAQLGIS